MTSAPVVTIIIPVYGVEKYISRCVHSLFRQTYRHIEYVFVNDCTKDNSIETLYEVMDEYPERKASCRVINHETNQGLSAARFTGIIQATGDYLMHVDSDDFLEENAVELLVETAVRESADIVIGGSYSVYPDKRTINRRTEHFDKDTLLHEMLLLKIPPSVWGKLFSAKLYGADKDTMPVKGINHGEDFATVPRLIHYAEKIGYLDTPIYNYVQYNSSSYTNNFSHRSLKDMIKATETLRNFFHDKLDSTTLDLCAARVKLALYKRRNLELYHEIRQLYREETENVSAHIPVTDRLLLFLTDKGLYRAASFCITSGLWLKGHRK